MLGIATASLDLAVVGQGGLNVGLLLRLFCRHGEPFPSYERGTLYDALVTTASDFWTSSVVLRQRYSVLVSATRSSVRTS